MLEDVHERLAGVVLEKLDWSDFIDRYDRLGTLFYPDPPYFGSEDNYGKMLFGRDQFAAMAERLKRLQGRFILSINDVPEIRETFAGFAFHQAELTYSVGGGRGTAARELIITDRNGSAPPNLNTILKALEGDFKGLGTMCAEGRIQTQLICARRCAMTQHCKQQVDRKHV